MMFTIGNDQLKKCKPLGKSIICKMCGKRHKIKNGKEKQPDGSWKESSLLSFYNCEKKSYLVGLNGKDIRKL